MRYEPFFKPADAVLTTFAAFSSLHGHLVRKLQRRKKLTLSVHPEATLKRST
jgi:hypothetical protein